MLRGATRRFSDFGLSKGPDFIDFLKPLFSAPSWDTRGYKRSVLEASRGLSEALRKKPGYPGFDSRSSPYLARMEGLQSPQFRTPGMRTCFAVWAGKPGYLRGMAGRRGWGVRMILRYGGGTTSRLRPKSAGQPAQVDGAGDSLPGNG